MFLMSLMLLQSGKSYASESYAASQSSVCGSYGILTRLAMSDSIGSSVIYPSSLAPYSLLPHQTMPVDSAYTARTQSLVHELREERDQSIMELIGKKKFRDGSVSFSPECARQIADINRDTLRQLRQLQVQAAFDPIYIESGLTVIFDHILKGYRAPSRSRSPARRRHPRDDGQDLEAA